MITGHVPHGGSVAVSPFGEYLRSVRVKSGKSLREVAEALGITHVYLGEIERGKRRLLPEKYWGAFVKAVEERTSITELTTAAVESAPLDPAVIEGPGRDVVVALARTFDQEEMSPELAEQLLRVLNKEKG